MTDHTNSAFHQLALYFNQSDIALGLWICLISVVVIAGIGFGCVCVTAGTPPPEGMKPKAQEPLSKRWPGLRW